MKCNNCTEIIIFIISGMSLIVYAIYTVIRDIRNENFTKKKI